jgi:VanZ family protein
MLWALIILILCGIPGKDIPHISFLELLSFDKLVHAGVFFVLVLLMIRGLVVQTSYSWMQRRAAAAAGMICVIYGGALEVMQETMFDGRSADVYDFIANSFGCIAGLWLYKLVERKILARLIYSEIK